MTFSSFTTMFFPPDELIRNDVESVLPFGMANGVWDRHGSLLNALRNEEVSSLKYLLDSGT